MVKMDKVYVVCRSGYLTLYDDVFKIDKIVGIFTDKEKAEELKKQKITEDPFCEGTWTSLAYTYRVVEVSLNKDIGNLEECVING